jgi:hypothetical protein
MYPCEPAVQVATMGEQSPEVARTPGARPAVGGADDRSQRLADPITG